jgi:hypothetical protein
MHPFRRYRRVLAEYSLMTSPGSTPGWIFTNAGERRVRTRLQAAQAQAENMLDTILKD